MLQPVGHATTMPWLLELHFRSLPSALHVHHCDPPYDELAHDQLGSEPMQRSFFPSWLVKQPNCPQSSICGIPLAQR